MPLAIPSRQVLDLKFLYVAQEWLKYFQTFTKLLLCSFELCVQILVYLNNYYWESCRQNKKKQ